jgi:hypothetical protein
VELDRRMDREHSASASELMIDDKMLLTIPLFAPHFL